MRKVERLPLSPSTMAGLSALTEDVVGADDPRARAAALWKAKPTEAFSEIRTVLRRMASGRERCMYCEDNEGTDVEHFRPKSTYPEKTFSWPNYLLACSHCNSNHKRARFPLIDGEPALLDPSVDEPSLHLRLRPADGKYMAIGPKGEASIEVFDLNGDLRGRRLPHGRRDAFYKLQVLLIIYDNYVRSGNVAMSHHIKRAIINEPFAAVLGFLLELARRANPENALEPGVAQAILRHRVAGW
ncbi:HNH endonuclease [Paraliomyxa miuraensis]|uniref:HNH endonuclease n=1 Tax=Paraliomyxa miuraensis TaxID=376150 RepID=UPI002257EC65|nr:HNH endonuclease [Paraliomyxa miuraensis]MCX4247542.1 HNH endonuclease [Paraliomyxa miuraensis]